MKQIILNITFNEVTQTPQIIANITIQEDVKFIKVTEPNNITEKDLKFYEDLKALINEYRA